MKFAAIPDNLQFWNYPRSCGANIVFITLSCQLLNLEFEDN